MGIFARFFQSPASESARAQILELQDRLQTVEGQLKGLQRDQATLEDYVTRQTQRLLKRVQRDTAAAVDEPAGDPPAPQRAQPSLMPLEQAWQIRRGR